MMRFEDCAPAIIWPLAEVGGNTGKLVFMPCRTGNLFPSRQMLYFVVDGLAWKLANDNRRVPS